MEETVVRLAVAALGAIGLVAVVGGCTSGGDEKPAWTAPSASSGTSASAPAWSEPPAYGYVLSRGCDAAAPLGRYRVTVRNAAVSDSEKLDVLAPAPGASSDADLGPITGQNGEEIDVPTLKQLLDLAKTASEDGGEVAVDYDTADGHPVKVTINVSDEGPSGAECFGVTEYRPAG